jgi:hypothetical protein
VLVIVRFAELQLTREGKRRAEQIHLSSPLFGRSRFQIDADARSRINIEIPAFGRPLENCSLNCSYGSRAGSGTCHGGLGFKGIILPRRSLMLVAFDCLAFAGTLDWQNQITPCRGTSV